MNNYKLSESSSIVLDLIRGCSSQLVVIGHGVHFFGIFTILNRINFPTLQNVAVLVFFLLSGFLITLSTVRKINSIPDFSFTHYFIDRFSRIYTAFIPAIILVALIDFLSIYINHDVYRYSSSFTYQDFLGNICMLEYFPPLKLFSQISIHPFGSGQPFWSLAIEWWIYMFFGYFVLTIKEKKKVNFINISILLFFSIVPLYNLISGKGGGISIYWIFGSFVYLLTSQQNVLNKITMNSKIIIAVIIAVLAFLRVYKTHQEYEPIFGFLLACLLFMIIDIFQEEKISKKLASLIRFNASYSFTLYLVHHSVFDIIESHLNGIYNPYVLFVVSLLFSNVLSMILGYYTETRLTPKVKRYLYQFHKKHVTI
jgi:peptidoglycan/LPS O-acetylase OafA/YrhL